MSIRRFIYAIGISLAALPASGAELVREFSGDTGQTTIEFEVEAPWILDWRLNSDQRHFMAFEIHLVDGVTGLHRGRIFQTKFPGNGVRLFEEGGRFRFRISAAFARYHLKVIELTREEAELYEPAGSRR